MCDAPEARRLPPAAAAARARRGPSAGVARVSCMCDRGALEMRSAASAATAAPSARTPRTPPTPRPPPRPPPPPPAERVVRAEPGFRRARTAAVRAQQPPRGRVCRARRHLWRHAARPGGQQGAHGRHSHVSRHTVESGRGAARGAGGPPACARGVRARDWDAGAPPRGAPGPCTICTCPPRAAGPVHNPQALHSARRGRGLVGLRRPGRRRPAAHG